jgi:hypothetical protein
MATKSKRAPATPRGPEKKYGPFHGGVGVAVWLNEVQTDDGPRFFRSATIQHRRFLDPKTGEWRDGSLRVTDVAAVILALTAAQQFMMGTPLPGQPVEEEHVQDTIPAMDGDVPF